MNLLERPLSNRCKNYREFRKLVELILFGNDRNTDFHDVSLFEVERLSGNQNAVAISRPDFAWRGS
jgi:hypothetical protein